MRRSRMILRTLSDRTTVTRRQHESPVDLRVATGCRCQSCPNCASKRTFVFPYVLERECEARVLSLDNAHFSKGTFADDSQQTEVVEIHWAVLLATTILDKCSGVASDAPKADKESGPMTLVALPTHTHLGR